MKDDLISREELKKTAKRIVSMPWGDEDGNRIEFKWTSEELEALIDKAPSASQWIPVTERLPEDTGKYLVTVKNGNVYAGTYDKFSGTFQCAATAWMPLPEPYAHDER